MLIHLRCTFQVNETELGHTNDREHENEKHEKQAERGHRWCSLQQSFEDFLQLLLLLDQSENTTDSQRPQDSSHNFQLLTHAGPVNDQDNGRENDYGEIEDVPTIFEVHDALGDQFYNCFNSEDGHEDVINDCDGHLVVFWLHVPIEGQKSCVSHDRNHNEHVEAIVLRYNDAPSSQC